MNVYERSFARALRTLVALAVASGFGAAAGAEVYSDFSVAEVLVIPQGDRGYLVTVAVEVIPGSIAPEAPIVLEMSMAGQVVAEREVETFGIPSGSCCTDADDCAVMDGYQAYCGSSCPKPPPSRECIYHRRSSFADLALDPSLGELVVTLDPAGAHEETADGAFFNNVLTAPVPPNEPTGGAFYDFGIAGATVTALAAGAHRLELMVAIAPEVVASGLPIALSVVGAEGFEVAGLEIDTASAGTQICCSGDGPCPSRGPDDVVSCSGTCTDPEQQASLPKLCVYATPASLEISGLTPGSELVARLDPEGLHTETAPGAGENNSVTLIVP